LDQQNRMHNLGLAICGSPSDLHRISIGSPYIFIEVISQIHSLSHVSFWLMVYLRLG
jgi:hypothetical protein